MRERLDWEREGRPTPRSMRAWPRAMATAMWSRRLASKAATVYLRVAPVPGAGSALNFAARAFLRKAMVFSAPGPRMPLSENSKAVKLKSRCGLKCSVAAATKFLNLWA